MVWASQWAGISSINLNGNLAGVIKGYLGNETTGITQFGTLITQGLITLFGSLDYAGILAALDNPKASVPYQSALNNALSGIVKGFF